MKSITLEDIVVEAGDGFPISETPSRCGKKRDEMRQDAGDDALAASDCGDSDKNNTKDRRPHHHHHVHSRQGTGDRELSKL